MPTLSAQLQLCCRILASMRSKGASADDIATQEAVCATVEKVKHLEDLSIEMKAAGGITVAMPRKETV